MAERATKSQTNRSQPQASRTTSAKLVWAVLFVLGAVGFLTYRAASTLKSLHTPALLHLGDDVTLGTPPALPADDSATLGERLRHVSELQALAQSAPGDPAAWAKTAQAAMRSGDYLTARAAFQKVLHLNAAAPLDLCDALGQCQAQLGLRAEAQQTYLNLLSRFPHSAEAYIGLSRAQASFGQKVESLNTLARATQAMRTIPDRLHIAHEYELRGDLAHALAEAQSVLKTTPDDPLAMVMTGHLLFQLVRLSEARQVLEKLITAHPEDNKARYTLAEILDNPMTLKRNRAMAEHILLDIVQHDPNDSRPYTKLGALYLEQGHSRQAAYIYIRLLELTPDSALARLQLSQAYNKLGDTKSAQEQREIAQRLLARDREEAQLQAETGRQPADGLARLKLAQHYLKAGQFVNALPALQAAYCLAPGNQDVQKELKELYRTLPVPLPTS